MIPGSAIASSHTDSDTSLGETFRIASNILALSSSDVVEEVVIYDLCQYDNQGVVRLGIDKTNRGAFKQSEMCRCKVGYTTVVEPDNDLFPYETRNTNESV